MPTQAAQEGRVTEDQLGGDVPLGHQPPFAVEVGEDEIEERRTRWATADSRVDHSAASSTSGTRVERPGPAPALVVAGDVVGGALVPEQPGHLGRGGRSARSGRVRPSRRHASTGARLASTGSVDRSTVRAPRSSSGVAAPGPADGGTAAQAYRARWRGRAVGVRRHSERLGGRWVGWSRTVTRPQRLPADEGRPEVGVVDLTWMSSSATCTSSRNSLRPPRVRRGTAAEATSMSDVGGTRRGRPRPGPGPSAGPRASVRQALDRPGEPVVLEEEAEGGAALGSGRHGPAEGLVGGQRPEHGHPVDHVVGIVAPRRVQVLGPDVEHPGGEIGPFEVLADGRGTTWPRRGSWCRARCR